MNKLIAGGLAALGLLFAALPQNAAAAEEEKPAPVERMKPLPVEEFYRNFEQVPTGEDLGALFGDRVYIGTAGMADRYNSLTLGWGATGILWQRPVAIVYIRENRFSFRFFEESPVFVLSWYAKKDMMLQDPRP